MVGAEFDEAAELSPRPPHDSSKPPDCGEHCSHTTPSEAKHCLDNADGRPRRKDGKPENDLRAETRTRCITAWSVDAAPAEDGAR